MLLFALLSCGADRSARFSEDDVQKVGYEVVWYSGFTLPDLLEQAVKVTSLSDISSLLEQPWYASFNVLSENSISPLTLSTCEEYLAISSAPISTVNEHEASAFMEIKAMCRAAQTISNAKPATRSFLSEFRFDEDLPDQLPKSLALFTSVAEGLAQTKNDSLKYWSDVNKIHAVELAGANKALYQHDAGTQQIELVAKGDFNSDGIEDLLISSRESVEGGTYNAIRIVGISKLSEGGKFVELPR